MDHLTKAGILVLEELRDTEEERGCLVGREALAGVEEEGDLGQEDAASSRLDRGAVEESSCVRTASLAAVRVRPLKVTLGAAHLPGKPGSGQS